MQNTLDRTEENGRECRRTRDFDRLRSNPEPRIPNSCCLLHCSGRSCFRRTLQYTTVRACTSAIHMHPITVVSLSPSSCGRDHLGTVAKRLGFALVLSEMAAAFNTMSDRISMHRMYVHSLVLLIPRWIEVHTSH
jgi:hypothetical protein